MSLLNKATSGIPPRTKCFFFPSTDMPRCIENRRIGFSTQNVDLQEIFQQGAQRLGNGGVPVE